MLLLAVIPCPPPCKLTAIPSNLLLSWSFNYLPSYATLFMWVFTLFSLSISNKITSFGEIFCCCSLCPLSLVHNFWVTAPITLTYNFASTTWSCGGWGRLFILPSWRDIVALDWDLRWEEATTSWPHLPKVEYMQRERDRRSEYRWRVTY